MDRIVLHSDANCFYASVEMLYHPELDGKPLAVGGDPEARHGIVLTANYIAKRKGVKTGMALWQAKQARMDAAVDDIRRRFGYFSIQRAFMYQDKLLSDLDAQGSHTVHPVGYFNGR